MDENSLNKVKHSEKFFCYRKSLSTASSKRNSSKLIMISQDQKNQRYSKLITNDFKENEVKRKRKDKFGISIEKASKIHRISFNVELVEIVQIESYKKLNLNNSFSEKIRSDCCTNSCKFI